LASIAGIVVGIGCCAQSRTELLRGRGLERGLEEEPEMLVTG